MPFGALAPLPLRLGGTETEGWSAAQQSRAAADLAALWRSTPLATMKVLTGTGGYVVDYQGRNGIGSAHAPSFLDQANPVLVAGATLTWDSIYDDQPWRITGAELTAHKLGANPMVASLYQITHNSVAFDTFDVITSSDVATEVTVTIYGTWGERDRQIGDYDGATDKEESKTEGYDTYAYMWLRELRNMRGSAYSQDSTSLVDAENLCIARQLSAISRAAEKLEANSLPETSDEKLENWAKLLDIPFRVNDQRWQVRQKCAAKLKAAPNTTAATVDDSIRELLGSSLVNIHRNYGTVLSSPPALTYWPGVNPGPASYSLGGGAWLSERAHYWVEVKAPTDSELIDFNRLMNIDYFQLGDLRLPAWATFAWGTGDGFVLDVSHLDFDAL